ncbi:MAG: response regulator [Pirellulales bacterium]
MPPKNLPLVLLVEDSPDDVDFARRALATSGLPLRLVVAERGEDALALLRAPGENAAGAAVRPALVLLDLNTPGTSGRELVALVKSDPELRAIPVVVLSTSAHRSDIEHCYRSGANSYHTKPDDFGRYQEMLRQIVAYWLDAVVLPASTMVEAGAGLA